MNKSELAIKRIAGIAGPANNGFAFTGYESDKIYRARKTETEAKVVISLELETRSSSYSKKWNDGPSDIARRNEVINQGLSYGAFVNGKMVGVLIMEKRDWNNSLHIEDIEVMPDFRGQGIGKRLLEKAEEVAKAEKARVISLETQNTNYPAIKFYRKNGYEIESIDLSLYTNDDVERGEVAIIMKRKL